MRWTGMDCIHIAQDREAISICKHGTGCSDYVKFYKFLEPLKKKLVSEEVVCSVA
jgi:hypothetical protein